MRTAWTRTALMQRIDRCYLVATWTRVADKRREYLERAHYYRRLLAVFSHAGWHAVPA